MKHFFPLIMAILFVFASCEGPMGPSGMDGEDGEDGYNFIGTTFEFTGNFTAANDYQLVFNFEDNGIVPYNSDVILTYILWTFDESGYDYWRALPQTEYFDSGAILQYNYDFTGNIDNDILYDMAVFLGGDVDFTTLPDAYTQNQTFRVVVVPSDFLSTNVDVTNIENVLNAKNLSLENIGTKVLN